MYYCIAHHDIPIMRFVIIILTFFVFQNIIASAREQNRVPYFYYSVENGLPSNKVYSITQDSFGYMWFATENGVVKYNGYSYQLFNNKNGLPSNDVWKTVEDKHGRRWLCMYANELGYIRNDKYHKLNYSFKSLVRLINKVDIGSNVLLTYTDGTFPKFILIDSNNNSSPIQWMDKYGVKIITSENELYLSGVTNNRIKKLELNRKGLLVKNELCEIGSLPAGVSIASVFNDQMIAILMKSDHFYSINIKTCKKEKHSLLDYGSTVEERVQTYFLINESLVIFTNSAIYNIGSDLSLQNRIENYALFVDTPVIVDRYKDKAKNTWFSTLDASARMMPNKQMLLQKNSSIYYGGENCTFLALLQDSTICWWQRKKSLPFFIKNNTEIDLAIPDKLNFKDITVQDKDNVLMLYNNTIIRYNLKSNTWHDILKKKIICIRDIKNTQYITLAKSINNRDAYIPENLNHIIFTAGLKLIHIDTNRMILVSSGLLEEVYIDKDTVYVRNITYGRYPRYYYDDKLKYYIHYNNKNILISDHKSQEVRLLDDNTLKRFGIDGIVNIVTDNHGGQYIHTQSKVYYFNLSRQVFKAINFPFDVSVCQITVSGDYLIIFGPQGLAYVHHSNLDRVRVLPQTTNAYYNQIYNCVSTPDQQLHINTDKGMYSVSLMDIVNAPSLSVHDKDFMSLLLKEPYQTMINDNDTLFIDEKTASIKLDFVNYFGKGEPHYKYAISGISKGISLSGDIFLERVKTEKYYKVKCTITDHLWESKTYTFYLYKHPHWWQSATFVRIFWVLGVLMLIFTVYLIISVTRYYVNKNNEKKNRLLDLELRAVYSQINPHFIFNTLSSAQFFIDKKNFDEAYAHISKFSKLLRGYLRSSQERYVTLSHEIMMLRNYIELQQSRFVQPFQYKIEVDNKIPVDSILIPSLLLQPLVENAINHGLFHKQGEGLLLISFRQGDTNNELICTIDDNGVGRTKAAQIKEESSAPQDSYGTMLTQKLIDIFKEYENLNIYLKYIDKEAPHTGTTVVLTIRNIRYDA